MISLAFPKIDGGHVTDAIFNEQGHVTELWIALDPDSSKISFPENFTVCVGCKIHLNTVSGVVAK